MAGFIQNILWNSVEGFVEAGKRTAGGYAGDALIKAGDMVENSGRSVGNGIENKFGGYGSAIAGQTYAGPSAKALPSTARKPAIKRSNSSPAAPKSTKSTGPSSYTPLGANKHPGGKQVGAATKQISSGVTGAKSTVGGMGKGVGGVVGGAQKGVTGVTGGAQKAIGGAAKSLPKPFPNNVPYGTSTTPQSANKSKPSSGLNSAKGVAENKANNLPKPYGGNAFPSSDKKTAVKPGQSKPFKVEEKDDKKVAPYPGTNTLPGQGSKTPVKKYKPMERLGPQVEQGKKMQHFTV